MFKQYWVYILQCSDQSFYIGVTNDLERRVSEHQSAMNKYSYTFKRRPVTLVYSALFFDVKEAIQFEKQIKGWCRRKKIALINGEFNKLHDLSSCSNETNFINNNT